MNNTVFVRTTAWTQPMTMDHSFCSPTHSFP